MKDIITFMNCLAKKIQRPFYITKIPLDNSLDIKYIIDTNAFNESDMIEYLNINNISSAFIYDAIDRKIYFIDMNSDSSNKLQLINEVVFDFTILDNRYIIHFHEYDGIFDNYYKIFSIHKYLRSGSSDNDNINLIYTEEEF